ncbi:MAG: hypothetical protein NVS3B21_08980 [Acidimicrobiales bacterium]
MAVAGDLERNSSFPRRLASARRARRFVRSTVSSYLPAEELDTVELLTSEVVTNAVIHAESSPVVEVAAEGGTVRVSVEDNGASWPMLKEVPHTATSGRGMALVDLMADAWGVERLDDDAKRVWFEVRGPVE